MGNQSEAAFQRFAQSCCSLLSLIQNGSLIAAGCVQRAISPYVGEKKRFKQNLTVTSGHYTYLLDGFQQPDRFIIGCLFLKLTIQMTARRRAALQPLQIVAKLISYN